MALGLWGKIRFACKVTELVLAALCMALFIRTAIPTDVARHPDVALLPVTFGGFVIVCTGLVLGFATGDKVPKKIDLLYTWVGVALFLAAGGLLIDFCYRMPDMREDRRMVALGCGATAIITGVVFIADIIFSYKDVHEYVPH
ncbi:Uncharacterized protein GBIM_03700 [Gryllus bimaculatus]|nr:Uncharacterized protein GBIM_03700 [Gryllus bimaculatus]